MALKDWKKIKEKLIWRKGYNEISITKNYASNRFKSFREVPKLGKQNFYFEIIYDGDRYKWVKTKSQALKYAKSYMRKH